MQQPAPRSLHQYGGLSDVSIEPASEPIDAITGAERMVLAAMDEEYAAGFPRPRRRRNE